MQVSDRLNRLSESATLAMARMSRELKAKGHNVIALSLGEPDFDTPDFIKNSAKEAIDNNYSHYTPVPGLVELREAIAYKLKRDNNLDYSPNQIIASTGAKQSIANVCLSILNPGHEVILPAPYWVSYYELVKLGEATPIVLESSLENDFKSVNIKEFPSFKISRFNSKISEKINNSKTLLRSVNFRTA